MYSQSMRKLYYRRLTVNLPYISPTCFISGGFRSEEDELDYLSSLLEIDDKTSKDDSPPSVGMYSYVYLYRM